ncbi:hypothetical protein DFH28DRAFT_477390 [Melampsora americana]|nr:hypothetical protein DFH28DRAFT_477390 [Melampsora americana]
MAHYFPSGCFSASSLSFSCFPLKAPLGSLSFIIIWTPKFKLTSVTACYLVSLELEVVHTNPARNIFGSFPFEECKVARIPWSPAHRYTSSGTCGSRLVDCYQIHLRFYVSSPVILIHHPNPRQIVPIITFCLFKDPFVFSACSFAGGSHKISLQASALNYYLILLHTVFAGVVPIINFLYCSDHVQQITARV